MTRARTQAHRATGLARILFFSLCSHGKSSPDLQGPVWVLLFCFCLSCRSLSRGGEADSLWVQSAWSVSTAQVCAPCAGGQRSRTGGDALEVKLLVQGHRSQRRRGVEGSRGCLSWSAQLAGRMPHSLLPVCPACSKKAEPISLSDLRGWIYLCRLKNGATSLPAFQFKLLSLWGGAGEGKQGDG